MKRLFFAFMILLVIAAVGYYAFVAFSVPSISFVTDLVTGNQAGNQIAVRRLYTADVDADAFYDQINASLISAEFSDEEIYQAALASGTPEFYPAFYFNISSPNAKQREFKFGGGFQQEFYDGQTDANFSIENVHLEMYSDNLEFSNFKADPYDSAEPMIAAPVVSEDKRVLAVNLLNVRSYQFDLNSVGTSGGRVTFQITYDVATSGLLPTTALVGQYLELYADINYSPETGLTVTYVNEPYSSLEDLE